MPRYRRTRSGGWKAGILVAALSATGPAYGAALAFASDAFGNFKNIFEAGEDVYAQISLNGIGNPGRFPPTLPEARVYVVDNGSAGAGTVLSDAGDGFETVSGALGSGFVGVRRIWKSPLTAGEYDIVLDEKLTGTLQGVFDGVDSVYNPATAPEFVVQPIPLPAGLALLSFPLVLTAGFMRRRRWPSRGAGSDCSRPGAALAPDEPDLREPRLEVDGGEVLAPGHGRLRHCQK